MIFDIECDGLNPTKIHCMSYSLDNKTVQSTTDYDEMRRLLLSAKKLIGHNIILFDIPVVERLLNVKITSFLVDTLCLSWYLYRNRIRFGLDSFFNDFNIKKPKIDDWDNLSTEEYVYRCEQDVKINIALYNHLREWLIEIYGCPKKAGKLVKYLSFKMDCVREQEKSRWKLDVEKAEKLYQKLLNEKENKINQLKQVMPPVIKYVKKTKPKKPYRKDGTYSTVGASWFSLLKEHNLPEDYDEEIKVASGEVEPNPDSHQQIKDWLFSLGWEPQTFKYVKEDDGSERAVPQLSLPFGQGICPSVLELCEKEPKVKLYEGLSIINHRITILNGDSGFLKNHVDGWLQARVGGLTNTLRFKHRELVNLPGVDKAYGEEIRGCLIAPDGYELCGSDMSSLEDMTKRHYVYDYDPEYVEEMSRDGFDPHLDLAKFAGKCTQEDIDRHQNKEDDFDLSSLRKPFKVTNYSCTYGVGVPKLARDSKLPQKEAKKLHTAFWERNWSITEISNNVEVKTIRGEKWLYNPVSELYYQLRYDKDRFSTLNQGTGVFCFDSWVEEFRKIRSQLTGQFHDEVILTIKKGFREQCKTLLKTAIKNVNEKLKLNVELDIDVQFGNNYADIH